MTSRRITAELRRHLDHQLRLAADLGGIPRPARGWVNGIRRALGMSEKQLGDRMGISQPSVHSLERSEADGTIRLSTLRRAAEALECELVYALIPRHSLDDLVTERARALARDELERVHQSMALEDQATEISEDALDERARDLIARGGLWQTF